MRNVLISHNDLDGVGCGVVAHRNRFGNTITCPRYVGNERIDKEWVRSPYSSVEARDKSLNNSILTDIYRSKGMVEVE